LSRTPYFTDDTFKFLRQLARNNNREWFAKHKPRYEEYVQAPFLRLIGDLEGPLAAISPHYRAVAQKQGGSLFRVYRDARFSTDKTPYKTWAGARLFHARRKELQTPMFYLQVQPGDCMIAAGMWRPEPPALKRLREFIVDNPAAWKQATQSPAFRKAYEMGGDSLSRPPRGYDPKHELIDDLKRKDFVAWRKYDDAEMIAPGLVRRIEKDLKGLAPLNDYLCAALDLEF
jgi:uncharacterized protein (TIGR02453 family)